MASNSRVTVTAEDIAESDDTLRGALSTWILKRGPVDYNKFQSAYFSVMRDHLFVDPDFAAGETQVVRQQRLMAMYRRIHEETWGQDWAAGIVRQPNGGEAAAEGTRRVREEYEKGTIAGDDPKAFRDKYRFLPYRFLPHGTNLRNMWAAMQREVYKTCPGNSNYIKLKAAFQQYRDANANWKDVLLAYRADKIKEWNQDYRCRCRWNQDYRCRCTKSRSGIKEWNQTADVDPDIALSKRARRDTHDTPPHKRAAVGGSDVVVERIDSAIIPAALVSSPYPSEVGHRPPCDDPDRVREGCEKGTIAGDDPKAFGDKYRFTLHDETETNLRNIWAAMQREAYKTCPHDLQREGYKARGVQLEAYKAAFQQYKDANTNWKDVLLAYRADNIKEWNQDYDTEDHDKEAADVNTVVVGAGEDIEMDETTAERQWSYDSGTLLSEADAKSMMDKTEARTKWLKANGKGKWLKAIQSTLYTYKAHEVPKRIIKSWNRYLARDPPSYDNGTLLSEADAKTMMDKIEARTKWLKANGKAPPYLGKHHVSWGIIRVLFSNASTHQKIRSSTV